MGIQGLLPQLKSIQNPVSLRRYEGQTLGIDGYAWLHRASCSCAYELAVGKPTEKYLQFFVKKLSMLRSFKIEPYLVFDGDAIGVKKDTEIKRREKRMESKTIAERLWKSGEKRNAMDYFQKCVDVTPEMAKCIIDYCKNQGIAYIVAPFEADAQMVYLEKNGLIQGIISEDSDLLIFGSRRLITKLNDFGECIEICRDDFNKLPHKFAMNKLSDQEIRVMVCLSGCDYTQGIPKVGLITAMKLVQRFRTLDRVLLYIQREGKLRIPPNFLAEFELANFAFQYQRVFCPLQCKIVTLNTIPPNLLSCKKLYECIGNVIHKETKLKQCVLKDEEIHHSVHALIATGELNPHDSHRRLVNREHKLQLSSKSEGPGLHPSTGGSINIPVIQSYFKKIERPVEKRQRPVAPRRCHETKLDEMVKRRKLAAGAEGCNASKFFTGHVTSQEAAPIIQTVSRDVDRNVEEDSEAETIIPESQALTQIPSSFVSLSTAPSSVATQEDDSDSLSELEEERKSVSPTLPKRSNTVTAVSCRNALQQFRYSSQSSCCEESSKTRKPLSNKEVNSSQERKNTRLKRQNILVATRVGQENVSAARPATRSLSLSQYIYKE